MNYAIVATLKIKLNNIIYLLLTLYWPKLQITVGVKGL